jgi:hypothetical protein
MTTEPEPQVIPEPAEEPESEADTEGMGEPEEGDDG